MVSSEAKNGFNCVSCGTFHRDEASCGVVRQNDSDPAKRFPFGTIVEGFCQVRVSQYIRRQPNLHDGALRPRSISSSEKNHRLRFEGILKIEFASKLQKSANSIT